MVELYVYPGQHRGVWLSVEGKTYGKQVLALPGTLKVSSAPRQCAEVFVDRFEQRLRRCQPAHTRSLVNGNARVSWKHLLSPQWDMGRVYPASIMRHLALFDDLAASSGAEGLDGKVLSLFHLCRVVVLDQKNRLPSVNLIGVYRMTTEVLYRLDCRRGVKDELRCDSVRIAQLTWQHLAVNLDLI